MGKDTDKMYITQTEWQNDYGGKKHKSERTLYKPLSFDCCAISFQPFEDPVLSPQGYVYDILNIIPFIQKHKVDPMTGEPLLRKELIKLHFHKNTEGKYHCPVTFKVFTDFSHIVAIRTSGNVYSMDAIEELNIKRKNWKDLVDETPFKKEDIINIQDPQNLEKRNLVGAWHIKAGITKNDGIDDPLKRIRADPTSKRVFEEMQKKEKEEEVRKAKLKAEGIVEAPAAPRGGQSTSVSFTSTSMPIATVNKAATVTYRTPKKKGFVQLVTSHGNINLELHCDLVPKTCDNFLLLCESGYYKNTIFHRVARNFCIQGGDPTGTGRGGESAWGGMFEDEFHPLVTHQFPYTLSMANAGPNTSKSQFFITLKGVPHLDNRHNAFGRVVGGVETITKIADITVDKDNRPHNEVRLLDAVVVVNPFLDLDADIAAAKAAEEAAEKGKEKGAWFSNPAGRALAGSGGGSGGVGKYLPGAAAAAKTVATAPVPQLTKKRPVAEVMSHEKKVSLQDAATDRGALKQRKEEAKEEFAKF